MPARIKKRGKGGIFFLFPFLCLTSSIWSPNQIIELPISIFKHVYVLEGGETKYVRVEYIYLHITLTHTHTHIQLQFHFQGGNLLTINTKEMLHLQYYIQAVN